MKRPGPFSTCHRPSASITPYTQTNTHWDTQVQRHTNSHMKHTHIYTHTHTWSMTADQALPPLPPDSNALLYLSSLSSSLLPSLPPSLPPVMYYECCLITQPRIPHTGWHIYLFALYLFAFLLYAKSFCDRVVCSLALPWWDQTMSRLNGDGVRLMVNPWVDTHREAGGSGKTC